MFRSILFSGSQVVLESILCRCQEGQNLCVIRVKMLVSSGREMKEKDWDGFVA